jgi:hypothetical protein
VAIRSSRYKNKVEDNLQRDQIGLVAILRALEQLVDAANGREPSSLMLPENRRLKSLKVQKILKYLADT